MEIGNLQTILGVIFGVGGAGALSVGVAAYRRIRTGKISDDESIIKRLYTEIARKDAENIEVTGERDAERARANRQEERAVRYRLQLISSGVQPYDEEKGT